MLLGDLACICAPRAEHMSEGPRQGKREAEGGSEAGVSLARASALGDLKGKVNQAHAGGGGRERGVDTNHP